MTSPIHFHFCNNIFTEKLHFWIKFLKSELIQNWKTEKNFKYVANICMYRGIMYLGVVILASIV